MQDGDKSIDPFDPETYHYKGNMLAEFTEFFELTAWEFNIVKYSIRKKPGNKRSDDLIKAKYYLERELALQLKKEQENGND